ncbi:hypothetical protein [Belliella aquatica]|uniref:hypothetical protein n=1 Tax=Belliella aquatica TaxID=1323734 RepID=UPI00166E3AD9|nr:hypothetical protein [Belliella aquatica]MCH7407656.1 hypothetical protein [Belliella aquatica]
MTQNSSNSEYKQSTETETNRESSIFSKIFRFVVRLYIKIIKYTVFAFIEIFKELLRIPFGKKTKKSKKDKSIK